MYPLSARWFALARQTSFCRRLPASHIYYRLFNTSLPIFRDGDRLSAKPRKKQTVNTSSQSTHEGNSKSKPYYSPVLQAAEKEIKAKQRKRKAIIMGIIVYFGTLIGGYLLFRSRRKEGPVEIPPPRDTTYVYDMLADKYDKMINREELFMGMSIWRRWVANQLHGDVLEMACGTGRNIKYMDASRMKSITFLDSSENMIKETKQVFEKRYPKYKNASYVVSKIEDIPDSSSNKKYDVIFETFGLCSHEDPVFALEKMQNLLKPGGRIILVEHGRGTYKFINQMLDNEAQERSRRWGCRWNLDIHEILEESGLEILYEDRSHFGTTWSIIAKNPYDSTKVPKRPTKWYDLLWSSASKEPPTSD